MTTSTIFPAGLCSGAKQKGNHGRFAPLQIAILLILLAATNVFPQSISSGTVTGTVKDESGAVVAGANVLLHNPVTNYSQTATTDQSGAFRLSNVPLNNYQLTVSASGLATATQELDVRSTILIMEDISLKVAASASTVVVQTEAPLLQTDPSAYTNTDTAVFSKLPEFGPAAGLSNLINYSTGGTAADANGFFHPLGDHAQVSFVIDGQPISDQQSKVFSTQLPPDAIQSMEIITGAPDAQYGDKSSLVVNATTGRPNRGSGRNLLAALKRTGGRSERAVRTPRSALAATR
jgi:Carboxypeptidase regulatory-like domain/TonB-dependent Receptor Plug Domain